MLTTFTQSKVGDSTTFGLGDPARNASRRELNSLLVAQNPALRITDVGPFTSGDAPTNNHCGVSGATCATILALVSTTFGVGNPYNPDVFQLPIGVNNAKDDTEVTNFITDYPALTAALHAACPNAGFVFYYIQECGFRQVRVDQLNGMLPAMWATMLGAGYKFEIVTPTLAGPADYDPTEGASWIHPAPVGYAKWALNQVAPTLRLLARL